MATPSILNHDSKIERTGIRGVSDKSESMGPDCVQNSWRKAGGLNISENIYKDTAALIAKHPLTTHHDPKLAVQCTSLAP